jgi:TonB family protein
MRNHKFAMLFMIGLAAQAAESPSLAAPPRLASSEVKPPVPANDSSMWVTNDDYPSSATREGRFGTSALQLTVDQLGKVIECTIIESSGSADLDNTACAVIQERAIFRPALDRRGRPVLGRYTRRVRWQLPDIPPVVEPTANFVGIYGFIARIHVTTRAASAAADADAGPALPSSSREVVVDECSVFPVTASNPPVHHSAEAEICADIRMRSGQMFQEEEDGQGVWLEIRNLTYAYAVNPGWLASPAGDDSTVVVPPVMTPTIDDPAPLPPHAT